MPPKSGGYGALYPRAGTLVYEDFTPSGAWNYLVKAFKVNHHKRNNTGGKLPLYSRSFGTGGEGWGEAVKLPGGIIF